MTKRLGAVLLVLATWPLLTAGGAFNPPAGNRVLSAPTLSFHAVIDPHMAGGDPALPTGTLAEGVTTTAKQATIRLRGGGTLSQAQFQILPSFPLYRGCDTSLTNNRFVFTPENTAQMRSWVPSTALQALFQPHGVTPNGGVVDPVITSVTSTCVRDPNNFPTDPDTGDPVDFADGGDGQPSKPGLLILEGTVEMLAAPRR